jgi:hypothetical protein
MNSNSKIIEGIRRKAMADDKNNRGNPDRLRININEDWEIDYWTKKLGVSREKLTELVRQHGDSAEKYVKP